MPRLAVTRELSRGDERTPRDELRGLADGGDAKGVEWYIGTQNQRLSKYDR